MISARIDKSVEYIRDVIGPRLGMQYINLGVISFAGRNQMDGGVLLWQRIVDVPRSLCERFGMESKGVLLLDTTQFAEAGSA